MMISKEEAQTLLPWLRSLRQELHRFPELALQEYKTAACIERELDGMGIPHRRVGATGVLGVLRGEGPGSSAVALRADIDALPVEELNDCGYRSQNPGVMHACGHDAHTAMLLGGARLLREHCREWGGEVRLCFQPGEETGKGANEMIAAGCLAGVRRVFGMHVAPELPLGTVSVTPGVNYASVDAFCIEVEGRSVHVSVPHLGVDAVYIGSHIVTALQAQVARRNSPVEPVLIGVGKFHAGTTYNALAGLAVLEGTVRTVSVGARQQVRRQVEETARSIAALYGGRAKVSWEDFASVLINDPGASAELAGFLREARPDITVKTDRPLALAGDNIAEYLLKVPGVYAYLGTSRPDRPETQLPIHTPRFEIDEQALAVGAWLHAGCAAFWLGQGSASPTGQA